MGEMGHMVKDLYLRLKQGAGSRCAGTASEVYDFLVWFGNVKAHGAWQDGFQKSSANIA